MAAQATESIHLDEITRSWVIHLRAANLSVRTIDNYLLGANQLNEYLDTNNHSTAVADIGRDEIGGFLVYVGGRRSSSTAATRYRALVQLFKWLHAEGEIDTDPMRNVEPPKIEEKEIPVLSQTEIEALLKTCKGQAFDDRRDTAIMLMFLDTGARLSELAGLKTVDIDFDHGVALVLGKGRRERSLVMGNTTLKALTGTSGHGVGTRKPISSGCGSGNEVGSRRPGSLRCCGAAAPKIGTYALPGHTHGSDLALST